ncbi:MAG: class I SAM-dependent methyltransferase [Gammaproteobacteria bacterium]
MSKEKKKHKTGNGLTMAETADRHSLYEDAVQCVESEIDFVDDTFQKLRNRVPRTLREDFCGTMNTSCEWVRRRPDNIAYGVDIDEEVLQWGRENKVEKLENGAAERIHVINDDVMNARPEPVDIVLAMNFSYWMFKTRERMKEYFEKIHAGLVEDGIFFLDAFGGYEAFQEMEESTRYNGFTYIWDQSKYNPITGECICHIHFKFKDGSKMKRAFSYEWRLWTLPEIQEILLESGFKPTIYWEGTDEDGEGDGVFTPATEGEADAGWIAYIVAEKQ